MPSISNARVILEDQVLGEGWVSFESGTITGIGQGNPIPADKNLDVQNLYLAPGFIDLHIHGGHGFDFLDATAEGFGEQAGEAWGEWVAGQLLGLLSGVGPGDAEAVEILKVARQQSELQFEDINRPAEFQWEVA